MKKRIITALPALLLCGCQLHPQPQTANAPAHAVTSPPKAVLQLTQLWTEGDLHDGTPLPVTVIRADSDRVTLSWNGDAVVLLRSLARARGQAFSYAGIRLPLPVDIEVQNITYANLLRIVEMQTAWRASLTSYPGQMLLQFMPAINDPQVRPAHGGKR